MRAWMRTTPFENRSTEWGVTKHNFFRFFSGGNCLIQGFKRPKISWFLVFCNVRTPTFERVAPSNTRMTACTSNVWFSVLPVLTSGNAAQIFKSVVGTISIDVVNLIFWPFSVHNQPSNPVRKIQSAFNLNADVSVGPQSTCFGVCFDSSGGGLYPFKFASFLVVLKMFLQKCKINVAHAVAPLKQWFEKWRLSVGSTGPLRHYMEQINGNR
jgi:hypothetical protein